MIQLKVRLMAEEIKTGSPNVPNSCPIAKALNRESNGTIGGYWDVSAETIIWHRVDNREIFFPTPYVASKWVKTFDKYKGIDRKGFWKWFIGTRFSEITFTLPIPAIEAVKQGTESALAQDRVNIMKRINNE